MPDYPTHWSNHRLGDLLEVQNGYAFDSELFSDSDGTPLIRIRDLKVGTRTEAFFSGQYDPGYLVNAGDYLVGMDGNFGCYRWRGPQALLNQRVCRLHKFSSHVDPDFIFFGINEHLTEIEANTSYATVKHLSSKQIKSIGMAFPSLDEQRRIAARIKACMERIDEIEGLRKAASKEATALRAAIAHDAWETLKLSFGLRPLRDFVASAKNGLYKPKEFHGAGTALLRMFNVVSGSMRLERIERLEVTEDELEKYEVREGDILVSRVNSRELVGKSAAVSGLDESAVFEAMLIRLRVKPGLDSYTLSQLMNAPQFLQDVRARAKHAIGQSSINQDDLLGTLIPNVPEQRLNELGQQWRETLGVAAQLGVATNRPEEAALLRSAVLRKAFAGEL